MKDENNLSLNELRGITPSSETEFRAVSSENIAQTMQEKYDIAPPEKPVQYNDYIDQILRTHGERVSDELFEEAKSILEDMREEAELQINSEDYEEPEEDEDSDIQYNDETIHYIDEEDQFSANIPHRNNVTYIVDTEELEDEIDDEAELEDNEARLNIIKSKIKEKIKPITNKIDLSSFTISNKPVSIFKAFESSESANNLNIADWILYSSGVQISVSEMKGYEIEKLNPGNSTRNQYNTYRDIYKLIYDHIVNEDKPQFEEFLKLIKFTDIPHLYFAIYKSSFNKQNILTYTCPKCSDVSVEEVDMDEMIKYSNKDIEENVKLLLSSGSEFSVDEYEIELLQISDEYVVGLREPSIFNIIFETSSLDEAFRVKHADIIGLISYIDSIYSIDRDSNTLNPIQLKVYEKDLGKTIKNKTIQYSKIINSLSSDQYYSLTAAISKITQEDNISYVIPERKCKKCNTMIPEVEQSPENLLFIRHQLGALANI